MKPLHIGLLIAAGAIGGVVVMRVVQPQPPAPAAMAAETAAPLPAETPAPVPAETPAVEPASPAPAPVEKPKPGRTHVRSHATPPAVPSPEPVETAQVPPPATAPAPATEAAPAGAAEPVPPAQPEPEHVTPPPPAPPEPHQVTLNAGMLIPVRLVDGLSTERNMPGDTFTATLDHELVVDGFVIAERGARVEGRVTASDRGGRVKGVAELGVELTALHLSDGQTVTLSTDQFLRRAEESHREDATKVGVGAALGAVIGAIAGGGKGAAIGAGAGGAAGAGTAAATHGKAATLPSETRLRLRLNNPVTITERMK